MNPLHDVLADAVRGSTGRPVLTYYDDATGERVELSAATLENWVAKTANLLRDEAGVAPSDVIEVALPAHWQTVVVVLACWRLGTSVTLGRVADAPPLTGPTYSDAAVAVTDLPRLGAALAGGRVVVGLALAPMGRGVGDVLGDVPIGVIDFAADVLAHGDHCPPADAGTTPATFDRDGRPLDYPLTLLRLHRAASDIGVSRADRVLHTCATRQLLRREEDLHPLLAPLSVGASLVLVANPNPRRLTHLAGSERVTVTWPMPDR